MVRFEWPDFPISDATERWLRDVQPYYLVPLEVAIEQSEGVAHDFTGASLPAYEEFIVDYFGDEQELIERVSDTGEDDQARNFALGTMGYLGETLMRVGGGWWSNDESATDLPGSSLRVHFDPASELADLSPAQVLTDAVTRSSGREFAAAHAMVEQAVATRREQVPDWQPVKIRMLGLDPPPPTEFLKRWLTQREQAFPQWAATHAERGTWDFSPDSLDALERLLRQQITFVPNDFANDEERALAEQAGWYLGEVMIRAGGGSWYYEPPTPGRKPKAGVGVPYLLPHPWHGDRLYPASAIRNMLKPERPLGFRERLARYTTRRPQP